MGIPSNALVIDLLKGKFLEFLEINSDLITGYYTQRPYEDPERSCSKDFYIEEQRAIEKAYNDQHREALRELESTCLATSLEEKCNFLLQKEEELLHKELRERNIKVDFRYTKLKLDDDTFTPDRWLELILGDRKKKEKEECRTKILDCSDYDIIRSYGGLGGEGANRSPFAVFTDKVQSTLKKKVDSLLQKAEIPEGLGLFSQHEERLKKLSAQERLFLSTNAILNSFSTLQYIQGGDLKKVHELARLTTYSHKRTNSVRISLPIAAIGDMRRYSKKFSSIINDSQITSKTKLNITLPPTKKEEVPPVKLAQSAVLRVRASSKAIAPEKIESSAPLSDPTPRRRSSTVSRPKLIIRMPSPTPDSDIEDRPSEEQTASPLPDLTSPRNHVRRRSSTADDVKPIVQTPRIPETDMEIIKDRCEQFFYQANIFYGYLSDYLTLLKVRIAKDFTEEVKKRAEKLRLHPEKEKLNERDHIAEDLNKLQEYLEVYTITKDLFQKLITIKTE